MMTTDCNGDKRRADILEVIGRIRDCASFLDGLPDLVTEMSTWKYSGEDLSGDLQDALGTNARHAGIRGAVRALQRWVQDQTSAVTATATRTVTPTGCEICGGPVTAERSTRRYCSDACRQAAYRARRES
jgi:hypothetical protein